MAVLVDNNTRLIVQGITAREGTFHAKGCAEYCQEQFGNDIVVGRRHPGKGGTTHEGWPVSTPSKRPFKATGAKQPDLRAGRRFRGRCILKLPPRRAAHRLHHRGHSDPEHGEGREEIVKRLEIAPHRANCPGRHLARKGKIGIMPGPHPQGRLGRHRARSPARLDLRAVYQLTTRGLAIHRDGMAATPIGTTHIDALEAAERGPGRPRPSS